NEAVPATGMPRSDGSRFAREGRNATVTLFPSVPSGSSFRAAGQTDPPLMADPARFCGFFLPVRRAVLEPVDAPVGRIADRLRLLPPRAMVARRSERLRDELH